MEVTTTILSLQTQTSTLLFTLTPLPPHDPSGVSLPSHTFIPGSSRPGLPEQIPIPAPPAPAQISSKLTTEVVTFTIVTVVPAALKPGLIGSSPSKSTPSEGSAPVLSLGQTTAPELNSSQITAPGLDSSQTLAPGQIPNDPTPGQSGNLTTPTPNSTPTPPLPLFSSTGASEHRAPLQTIDDGAPDFQVSLRRYYRKLRSQDPATIPTPFYISSIARHNHSIIAATRITQSHRRSAKLRAVFSRHYNGPSVNSQERLVERNGEDDRERNGRVGLSAPEPVPETVSGGTLGDDGRSAPATRSDFLALRARLANIEAQISPPEYFSESGQ